MAEFRVDSTLLRQDSDRLENINNGLHQVYSELRSINKLKGMSSNNASRILGSLRSYTDNIQNELNSMKSMAVSLGSVSAKYSSVENKTLYKKNSTSKSTSIETSLEGVVAGGVAGSVDNSFNINNRNSHNQNINGIPLSESSTDQGSFDNNVERSFYYNKGEWAQNGNVINSDAACLTCSWTMVMNGLGINVSPFDIYETNGNKVYVQRDMICNRYALTTSRVNLSGGSEERYEFVKGILANNPQGVIIGSDHSHGIKSSMHHVYAYLDSNGNIRINDSGLPDGKNRDLNELKWAFSGWDDIEYVRTVNRK